MKNQKIRQKTTSDKISGFSHHGVKPLDTYIKNGTEYFI